MRRLDSVPLPFVEDRTVDDLDAWITTRMNEVGPTVLRHALGTVFVWFGALKIVGVSPAGDLVAATVYFVPAEIFVPVLGVWEVLIGLCLFASRFIRAGILLLALQMPGTFLPVVLLPDVVFTAFPYGLTVEGQYIIKNLVIIGAGLVVGGHVRGKSRAERGVEAAGGDGEASAQ